MNYFYRNVEFRILKFGMKEIRQQISESKAEFINAKLSLYSELYNEIDVLQLA